MANYWIEFSDGEISDRVSAINELTYIAYNKPEIKFSLYASGSDIDFETYLIQRFQYCIDIIVCETTFESDIILKATDNDKGYPFPVVFKDCTIKYMKMSKLKLANVFFFHNCKIGKLDITSCTIENFIKFLLGTEIDYLHVYDNIKIEGIIIEQATINTINIFGKPHFNLNNVIFKNSQLYGPILIDNCFIHFFHIERCSFKNFKINNSGIVTEFSLSGIRNKSLIEFSQCFLHMGTVSICNSSVTVIFKKNRSNAKELTFDFNDNTHTEYLFDRCYFAGEVVFKGAIYSQIKNLKISETVFKELVLFDDDNAKSIEIEESLFQKGVLIPVGLNKVPLDLWWYFKRNFDIYNRDKKNRESIHSSVWCTLKNQAISRNDKISALEYRRYEMNSYAKELKKEKYKGQEKVVLYLNKLSNDHGLSWFRAVCFTFVVWITFYLLFVMSHDNFDGLNLHNSHFLLADKSFWTGALNFLWLPDGIDFLTEGLKGKSYLWCSIIMVFSFFVGKIAIAYGIFQTISSFRKHGQI